MSAATQYETKEISFKDSFSVNFLYNTLFGRMLLLLLTKPAISKFGGFFMDTKISKILIPVFIKNNKICLDEYEKIKYASFNDFFKREIKKEFRPISKNISDVFACCDGKLTAYFIDNKSAFKIKNSIYDIGDLLADKQLADEFIDGICLIFRLTPNDYHRYCYIDDGEYIISKKIKGVLHAVRPIALSKYKVYTQNSREYAVLQTKNFGKIIQMEVGALFIGRITNNAKNGIFSRGEEKGMFEFGGSTIVMLFQKNAVKIDNIIYENTQKNRETVVKMGNKIGEKTIREKEK
ncbi:MAG: phosphatidylserine decarboxylase [Chitinivibrionia bacterium]|nr:phosphatidylserine decarboxylase [Chitinivibrionia bacterium]